MLINLTHPEADHDLWIDPTEIIVMERYNRPKSGLITLNDDKPIVTALVLRCGRILSCKETPAQVLEMMKGN